MHSLSLNLISIFLSKWRLLVFISVAVCGLKYSNINDNGDADIILHIHEIWGY